MTTPTRTPEATVFVVDDDAAVRDSLGWLVRSVGIPVETYATAQEFLSKHDPARASCLILDVRMRGMSGLELQEELVRRSISIPVIVISGHADVPTAVRALKAGAVDFLEKPFSDQDLLDRVQRAIESDLEARQARAKRLELAARLAALSPREREVVDLLADGKANKEIAALLGLSTRTVEGHRARIMDKLGAESFAEVVRVTLLSRADAGTR